MSEYQSNNSCILCDQECACEQISPKNLNKEFYEDNNMFFEDAQGGIVSEEELNGLAAWEIEEREFHIYDPRIA